jgi:hypothetical protein
LNAPDLGPGRSANLYGLGFGARGGYAFPCHFYAGGRFTYFLGKSEDFPGNRSLSLKIWTLVAEAGYQFEWDAIRLRPYVGLGIADGMGSVTVGTQSVSDSTFYFSIQPGAVFEYSFSGPAPGVFIGADIHLSLPTGSNTQGIVFLGTGGYRF